MWRAITKACCGTAVAICAGLGVAHAQSPYGYGTIVTIPVVVSTATFSSEIYIHNPTGTPTTIDPWYYGGDTTATVGFIDCPDIVVPANGTSIYSLTSLCPGLAAGSNFGRLRLYEINTTNKPFSAYARINSFSGNGFSVEGFPVGNFGDSKSSSFVNGLKRVAAAGGAPAYQTNCFIGSLQEAVGVDWQLETGAGTLIGAAQHNDLTGTQFVRILDVFSYVGAAAGDFTNVRARFAENGAGEPSFVAFCTVQNNTSFDADFRIAKTYQSSNDDQAKLFTSSVSFTAGATTDLAGNLLPSPNSSGVQHNWVTFLQHPDWVSCSLTGIAGTSAEMQMLSPTGVVVAGGSDATSFPETFLGEKSTQNNGVNGSWIIQVGAALFGSDLTSYTLTCTSGNGMTRLIYAGSNADSF